MIENESALDLFQRLRTKPEQRIPTLIERLNRSFRLFFPHGVGRAQLVEIFSKNRTSTKRFLHRFLFDYFQFVDDRDDFLRRPFEQGEIHSNSPRANNKDSVESDVPILQTATFDSTRLLRIFYIDTEFNENPFVHRRIHWFDCSTSSELLSTFLLLEKLFFEKKSNEIFLLIINSTSQMLINDYFLDTSISIDEQKRLTNDWQRILSRMLFEHRFSCLLIENVAGRASEFSFSRFFSNNEIQIDYRSIFDLPLE